MQNTTTGTVWQQNILSLPDEKFFEIIRLYLGKIQTPYNRQRLVEQLVGFLKNEENSKNLLSLIDLFDIKLLTAIGYIPNVTQEILVSFFAADYPINEIISGLANLQERLIIFTEKDAYSNKKFIRINPFLQEILTPLINISNILDSQNVSFYSMDDKFCINTNFIAGLISFLKSKNCSFKADGNLKKTDLTKISSVFTGKEKTVELLIKSFFNLNLLIEGEKSFEIDNQRFELFATQSFKNQMALICAASCSRFSREGLKKEAQLFLDVMSSIPASGYSISSIIKLAFLTGTTSQGSAASSKSRFSRILESARQENAAISENAGPVIEKMIDSAIQFGILQLLGKTEDGTQIYNLCDSFNQASDVPKDFIPKVLNIDSTYTVSLMPGLSLSQLLPLTDFINIKNWDTVSEYDITRQSVTNAFDKGWTPESIFEEFSKYSNYDFPQNLKMSIEDWYKSYMSARLFQGYVLKVTDSNITFVENNPRINKYIKEKLEDGIYLLNLPVTADISEFVSESGLDFMGKIKEPSLDSEKINFPMLRPGYPISVDNSKKGTEVNFSKANELITSLKNTLQNMDVDENQKESLAYRIRNRLILTPHHLQITSVRSEILEADGMDYSGKVFLLEAACKDKDKVELTIPDYSKQGKFITLLGNPLAVFKQENDSILRFQDFVSEEVQNIIVSRITHVKRIRF